MLLLQLTLLFGLVVGGKPIDLYHSAGDEVIIPCRGWDSSETSCSRITWRYRGTYSPGYIIRDGQIQVDSPVAAKVSLDRRCFLTIRNVSSEDAGDYACYYGNRIITYVYLFILTISADQSMDPEGGVTLTCTLWNNVGYCESGSLLLMDEEGAELGRKDLNYTLAESCPSFLTLTHQRNHSRQYTCQFVKDDGVRISDTLVSTEPTPNKIIFILNIAKMFLLIILVVIVTPVQIKYRRRTGAAEDAKDQDCVLDEEDLYDDVGPAQHHGLNKEEEEQEEEDIV